MIIEQIKRYLKGFLNTNDDINQITILYKNLTLKNEYSIRDIEKLFNESWHGKNDVKITFNYSRANYGYTDQINKVNTPVRLSSQKQAENENIKFEDDRMILDKI